MGLGFQAFLALGDDAMHGGRGLRVLYCGGLGLQGLAIQASRCRDFGFRPNLKSKRRASTENCHTKYASVSGMWRLDGFGPLSISWSWASSTEVSQFRV